MQSNIMKPNELVCCILNDLRYSIVVYKKIKSARCFTTQGVHQDATAKAATAAAT